MPGVMAPTNPWAKPKPPTTTPPGMATSPSSITASYQRADDATKQQQAQLSQLWDAYKSAGSGSYTPATFNYQPTPEYNAAIGNLGNIAQTGGYSPEDIANIRERSISPIRSLYAGAQQNITRNKTLQGGYSPNYTAAQANLTRGMSDAISNQTGNVNAQIAQNIAQNKLSASSPWASIAAGESNTANQMGARNADVMNEASRFNLSLPFQALQGQSSLYGATPGLSQLFGNQALSSAQLQNMINQGNTGNMLQILQSLT
jgi:hypothetical protein